MRRRKGYPSDRRDAERALIAPLVPPSRGGGRHPAGGLRGVVAALCYLTKEGCRRRGLPHDFPAWPTVATLRLISVDGGCDTHALHLRAGVATAARLEVARRPGEARGFVVLRRRWVVARTLAWLPRYRRPAKDIERLIACSTTFLYVASIHVMVRRLAQLRAHPQTNVPAHGDAEAA